MPTGTARLLTPTFLLIAVATLAYFTADGVLIPTVSLYVEGPLAGSSVAVGVAVGAFSVSALLLRPWAGQTSDRVGRKPAMVFGAGLVMVSVLGLLVARSVPTVVAMRFLAGAGEAFFFVGAASAISDIAPPERRGEAMSFFSLALYAGIGIGPLLGEGLIRGTAFHLVWLAGAGIALLAALLPLRLPETRPPAPPEPPPLINKAGLLPGAVLLASLIGMGGFFAFVPLYSRAIGLGSSRLAFVLFSVVVLVIRSVGAKIPDRMGVRRASRAALGLSTVGLALIGGWGTPAGLYLGTAVFATGIALATPALMALAVSGAPDTERGSVLATFTAFIDLSFGLGPIMLGLVVQVGGYQGSFVFAAGVAALGFAALFSRRAVARTAPQPSSSDRSSASLAAENENPGVGPPETT